MYEVNILLGELISVERMSTFEYQRISREAALALSFLPHNIFARVHTR